jgi:5-methylcytosine-specific restriction endonuclease McrA
MATEGKRSPTSHRTPAQIRAHGKGYQASPKQRKNRAKRNKARATMVKEGRVRKGDGKDVDHKRPLIKGGGNSRSNLRVSSARKNRGHGMSGNGRSKSR